MFNINDILALGEKISEGAAAPVNVMAQPTFFETTTDTDLHINRTAKQKNNLVSYDIGEVAGSRKELAALKKAFLESKSRKDLEEIALIDDLLATELATKKNIFSWFSMDSCMARKVDVTAAYGMHLLIRRLPADSKGMYREDYLNAIEFISNELYRVKTEEQLKATVKRLGIMANGERELNHFEKGIISLSERIERLESNSASAFKNKIEINRCKKYVVDYHCYIASSYQRDAIPLHKLGTFSDFITSSKKRATWWKSINKYETWEDYTASITERTEKKASTDTTEKKKSVWERELPVNPIRNSDVSMPTIMVPEDYVNTFKFRANQMGHWMKDSDALGHLRNSGSGFVDLAYLLDIPVEAVSLKGSLAMAFGARGSGRALAHFERGKQRNVINMTKTKGSLGVLSHEWLHALDYYLRNMLEDGNPFEEMLSEHKESSHDIIPIDILLALVDLLSAMKDGKSTAYYDVSSYYRVGPTSTSQIQFASSDYDMQRYVDLRMEAVDELQAEALKGYVSEDYRNKMKKRYEKRRKDELKKACHLAAKLHQQNTGEEVTFVPYTINQTAFYSNAKLLDGKRKPYWATDLELMARGFEAYIQRELANKGMQNDYLVCGAYGLPYPTGEELDRICAAFKQFIEVVRPYLMD